MTGIADVRALEVLDSRGNPTVEVQVTTEAGNRGRAIVPSGASTGSHEAMELRDGGRRYLGKGVQTAVRNVHDRLLPAVRGVDACDQAVVDRALLEADGTPQKRELGANAVLGVSLAAAHAGAADLGLPLWQHLGGTSARTLPVPMMNILNGGAHADTNVSIQEFMVVPAGAASYPEALRMGVEVYHHLKSILKERGLATAVGDEGGFAPDLPSNVTALELIEKAVGAAGYDAGSDVVLALDVAATEFYDAKTGSYDFGQDGRKDVDSTIRFYDELLDRFPIISIEDGMAEDDHEGWQQVTSRLGRRCQLVGDDVFVTDPDRLRAGIEGGEGNAILLKVNQIGTLTETLEVVRIAQEAGYGTVVSHRSGETEDATIAHLAVATGAGQIKTGAPARSDRVAKYNELLRIQDALGEAAVWRGAATYERYHLHA